MRLLPMRFVSISNYFHFFHHNRYMIGELTKLQTKYPQWIGDVRGLGLFLGIEFVKPPAAGDCSTVITPHPDLTKFVVDFIKYEHVIGEVNKHVVLSYCVVMLCCIVLLASNNIN